MGSALLLLALSFVLASNAAAQGMPTLSITGDTVGTVFEDGSDAMLNASGRLIITDGILMDYTFVVQSGMPGIYGTFSIDAEGNWMYMLDNNNPETDALAIGAEETDTFTAVSSDDGTVFQEVAITITGANDAPTISMNALSEVTQGAEIILISVGNDVDTGDNMLSYAWSAEDDLGLFTNGTGRVDNGVSFSTTWRAPDEIRGVRLNLTVTDDNGAVNSSFSAPPFFVEVTPASLEINGAITGSVTEDDPASTMASGTLTIDTTANNRDFVPQTDTGMYGTFEIDVGGAWTYILDNNAPATNTLAAGAEVTDTFTVASSLRPTSDTQEVTITVTGANDAPEFDPTSYDFDLAENRDGSTAPIEVGTVTATDPEGDTIAYSITDGNTALFSIDEDSGVIAYMGTGENFEAVPPPYILEITATAGGQMNTVQVTVTVTDENDPPEFAQDSYTFDLAENQDGSTAPINVGTVTATDPESDPIAYSITVGDTTLFSIGETSGVIAYTGTGEDFEAEPLMYALTLTATAGSQTNTAPVTVTVTDENDPPEFAQASYTFDLAENQDGSTMPMNVGTVTATDLESDPIAYSITDGDITLFSIDETSGAITYMGPGEDFEAEPLMYTLEITATAVGRTNTAQVTVTVTNVNEPPEFDPASYAFNLEENQDGSTMPIEVGRVTAPDPEGDAIAYSITIGDTNPFSIGETSGEITYTGAGEDFEAGPRIYTLEITATANSQTGTAPVMVTITDANDAPVASITGPAANTEVSQGESISLTGTGDDDDTGDTLSYAWSASPNVGSFTNGDRLNATWAAPDALGPVMLTLTVTDNSGAVNDSSAASVTVMIIRALLEISGDTVGMVTENAPSNITNGVLTIATTANDRNFVQTSTVGTYGSFIINANGTWTYTLDNNDLNTNALDAGDVETDTFTVMSNLQPAVTEVVTITITGANDAPVATDDAFTVLEGGTATTLTGGANSLLANDDDVDAGATLMVERVENVSYGTLTLNEDDGTFSYTHDGSENHDDFFTYRVSDGSADSNVATVTITVTPEDDAPEFDQTSYDFTLEENRDGSTIPVAVGTVTATDAESDLIAYSISSGDTTRFNIGEANGAISYTGAGEDFEAVPSMYTLEITATANSQTDTAPVTVTITDANDAPVASIIAPADNAEVKQGVSVFLTGTGDDVDTGDTLSYAWSASPDVGSFTNGDMLNATWAAPDALDPVTLTLTVTDDSGALNNTGTASVTVTIIEALLQIRGDTVGMVTENAPSNITRGALTINTTATDRSFVQTDTAGIYGSFIINTNGTWTYTLDNNDLNTNALDAGDVETDTFTVMSNLQPAVTEVVTITITGANDAPVAMDDAFTVLEGGTATTLTGGANSVLANDDDVDDEATLMVERVENVRNGTLVLNEEDGTFSYTHDGSENHDDFFTYRVSDGIADSNDAMVTITVTPEDDAPEFDPTSYDFTLAENQDGSMTLVAVGTVTATDAESDLITYSISSGDTTRFNIDEANGAIAYTGAGENFEAVPSTYTLEITATANSQADTAAVTVTITDENEPPEFDQGSYDFDLAENRDGSTTSSVAVGTVTATDPESDSIVYSISNGGTNPFSIDGVSGAIAYTGVGENFEAEPLMYTLEITATANSQTDTAPVTVTITDENEPPEFDQGSYDFDLAENRDGSTIPVAVGTVTATDPEGDSIVYSISSGGTNPFSINGASGAIAYTGDGEDFEAEPLTYTLEITATANAQPNTAPVTVTITDANEAPVASITEPAANMEVNQGVAVTLIGTGDDVDTGDTLSYEWSASPGVGSFTNGDMLNATWTAPDPLDPVTLTLTVTDDSGDTGTAMVTIMVTEASLTISGTNEDMVTEDAAIITANGDLDITTTASDRTFVQTDTPVPGTYGSFTIATNGIWTYTLDNTDLDTNALGEGAEVTDTFTVMSRLQPAVTEDVTITITGANDAPIALDDVFLAVEGSGIGGELPPATDVDTDEFLLSVITTPVENVSRGSLTLSDDFTFDYEHDGSETTSDRFTYRVMDDFGAVSNVATVIITVIPEDDPPEFEEAAYDFDLAENLDGSTTSFAVGTVIATDAESDPIIYSISSGDTARFNIDETSGVIAYIGTGEDFEAGPSMYMLEVTATSNSETATAEVTVTVTDEREIGPPEFEDTPYSFNLAENLDGSTTPVVVGRVLANAPDDPDITYRISSGDTDRFDIQSLSGRIRYTGAGENFEAAPSMYILEITATTTDGLDDTAQVTVTITDANDVPAAEAGPAQIVDEGASVTLDGSSSTDMDPDDDTLNFNYAWTQTEGMTVTLTGANTVSPTFAAPTGLSEDETLTFQLIVTDVGGRPSEPDTVIITVATPPSFGDTVIEIQRYTTGRDVPSVTLPEPTGGGDGLYTYTVDNQDLPAGVSFDATTRVISGTVTALSGRATHTYTVTDGRDATDTISFDTIIVNPPSFGTATFPDLTFVVRDPVNLTLPPASEGSPPLSYRLERAFDFGPVPAGLSFDRDPDERVLSGIPNRVQDREYRYIATDANGAEAPPAGFRINIETNSAPNFGATTPPLAFTFARGITIPARTLPAATGGNGLLSYDIVQTLPEGLAFDPDDRILFGAPTTEQDATDYTYRVQDEDGNTEAADAADLIFSIEIIAPPITFSGTNTGMVTEDGPDRLPENDDEAGTTSRAAGTLTIINPGGDASFIALTEIGTYGLFNMASNGQWTYTLDNGQDTTQELAQNASAGDTFNVVATAFDGITHPVSITVAGANDAPGVLLTSGIPTIMEPEEFIVLSARGTDVDSGETDTLSYQWSTDPPDRGSFDAPNSAETGWAAPAVTEYEDIDLILTVDDGSGTDTSSDTIEVMVRIIAVNVEPGFSEIIDNQIYTVDADISDLTLPEATNGNPPFSYNITPDLPTGLSFDPDTRVLSGRPAVIPSPPTGTYTYTVTDSDSTATDASDDSGTASLVFDITINQAITFSGDVLGRVTEDGPDRLPQDGDTAGTTSRATGMLTITNPNPGGDTNFVALTDIDVTYGTFSMTTDGIWTYILDNSRMATQELLFDEGFGASGTDTLTVMAAADPNVLQTITITVDGADDAPTINIIAPADRATVAAGATIAITAIGMDVDSGQTDRLSYQWITEPPGQGSFTAPSLPDTVWTAPTVDTDLDIMLRLSVFDDNELEGNAAVTLVVEVASPNDVNADAIVQVRDLQIIYYVALSPPNLDALLNRLRGIAADVAQLSARATAWLNRNPAEVTPDPDLNGDGTLNQQDARILYYALRFEDELRASPALQRALGVNMLALQSALDLRDE